MVMRTPSLGESLHRLLHAYKRVLQDGIARAGIPLTVGQIRVLKGITDLPTCTAQAIASGMQQDKGQIARLVKELEARELVTRSPDPEDSRRLVLEATPSGRAMRERLAAVEVEAGAAMAAGLDADQVATFVRLAELMTCNLQNSEESE